MSLCETNTVITLWSDCVHDHNLIMQGDISSFIICIWGPSGLLCFSTRTLPNWWSNKERLCTKDAESSNHNDWSGQSSCNSRSLWGSEQAEPCWPDLTYSITNRYYGTIPSSHLHHQYWGEAPILDGHVCLCTANVNLTSKLNKSPFSNLC